MQGVLMRPLVPKVNVQVIQPDALCTYVGGIVELETERKEKLLIS
jgi:hypothetical protein